MDSSEGDEEHLRGAKALREWAELVKLDDPEAAELAERLALEHETLGTEG